MKQKLTGAQKEIDWRVGKLVKQMRDQRVTKWVKRHHKRDRHCEIEALTESVEVRESDGMIFVLRCRCSAYCKLEREGGEERITYFL